MHPILKINAGNSLSVHRDTENGIKIMCVTARFCNEEVHVYTPMCNQSTACNQHWHLRHGY